MDIGMSTEFKVKLTSKNDETVYSQKLLNPRHLKENLIVELTLMHKYEIITVLPFSKYVSLIFAQREPNRKLHLLVDLRKVNRLIAKNYTNNDHSFEVLSNAAQYLAGKSFFCMIDCCHCLQLADQRSLQKLAFEFVKACKGLAQGLRRFVSAFSRFCVSPSTCTQLPKLTKVLITWARLGLQPMMLRTLLGRFGQSSSAFAKQD